MRVPPCQSDKIITITRYENCANLLCFVEYGMVLGRPFQSFGNNVDLVTGLPQNPADIIRNVMIEEKFHANGSAI